MAALTGKGAGAGEGNRTLVFSLEVSCSIQCFHKPFRQNRPLRLAKPATEFRLVGMSGGNVDHHRSNASSTAARCHLGAPRGPTESPRAYRVAPARPVSPALAFFRGPRTETTIKISRQHARVDELHTGIGCQPIFDARFPRSPGRHYAADLPACALSSYNLRNPRTIINHWAFD